MNFTHSENEMRKQTAPKHHSLLAKILLLMTCAVLLAGARGQEAAAAAKISDHIDALLADKNAEADNITVNTGADGTVYEAKKVTKKETVKKTAAKKSSDKNTKAKKSENKASSDKKADAKESKKEKSEDKETKSAKKDKDSKTADKDTETPTHYTVHTATGAKRLEDEYQDYTYQMCEKYGIAEYFDLILIQMCMESGYNMHAVGASRYYGPMQISSASFARLEATLGLTDIREPHQNIEAGVYLMSCLISKYGDPQMALVCYHRGESAARRGIRSDSYSARIVAMQSTLEEA